MRQHAEWAHACPPDTGSCPISAAHPLFRVLRAPLRLALSLTPIGLLKRLTAPAILIPYYHLVSDERLPHLAHFIRYPNRRVFEDQLDALLKHYTPVDLDTVLSWMQRGGPLPRHPVLLTFDDGYREQVEVAAPILRRKGVPAAFFLATEFLDNQLLFYRNKASLLVERVNRGVSEAARRSAEDLCSAEDLRGHDLPSHILSATYQQSRALDRLAEILEVDWADFLSEARPYLTTAQVHELLAEGHAVGAHSVDHPPYPSLSVADQLQQTTGSVDEIHARFQLPYRAFAFPFTDSGVSLDVFRRLTNRVDVTFGTNAMYDDLWPNHLQRFPMDNVQVSVETYLRGLFATRLLRVVRRRNHLLRPGFAQ